MLVNLRQILSRAQAERYAVGGFNMTTLESAQAIVEAAASENSPVILQISEKTIEYMGLPLAFAVARTCAESVTVPVVIHFDHGKNWPLLESALKIGFSSIMIDASKTPINQRILLVKDFVNKAHRSGATVEAEEDVIGGVEDYVDGEGWQLTDPKRASKFVSETRCDAFAVSIGSSHGKPLPNEKLDFELLKQIRSVVKVPLVLHGASSTPQEVIREVIAQGIVKINIDTDLRLAFSSQLRTTLGADDEVYDPREYLSSAREAVKEAVVAKIRLFGSNNKAG